MEEKSDSKTTFNAPEVKLHFLDYWRIIRIRKTVILAVFLLVTITTTVVTFILPKTYDSTVRMKVQKDVPDVEGIGIPNYASGAYDPYWVTTEFETIQSKSILYPVITNLDLTKRWAEKMKMDNLSVPLTFQMLRNRIDVRQARNTSLIEIRAFSDKPREAAEIANEIARVYRESRLEEKADMASGGIAKLEEELQQQDDLITAKQDEVDEIKTQLGISDYEAQGYLPSTPEPEILRRLEAQRIEAKTEFTRLDTMYTSATNLSRAELKKAAPTISQDPHLAALLDNLSAAEQKLAQLIESYTPNHPDVKSVNRIIEAINRQVDERLDGIVQGFKTKRDVAEAALRDLEDEVDKFKQYDIDQAIKRRPYFQGKRELESLQYVRERLAVRIIQAKVDTAIPKTSIVKIIDPAEPAMRAVKPNKILNITLGIIVGLSVGIGLAFFIEYLDTSVKTIDDVERALQAPVLGVIPQNVGSLIEEGPDSPHAEAYRVLRTNILFSQKDPKLNTITVVSGGAGEGKSTTIFNLATVFAQNGHRVLICDSDLRRPAQHKLFRVSNSIGLTNFLLKQNSLEEVIQTTPVPTLDFMPSGKLPSSSMGVLSSDQMKELIRDLKRRYDYVFFDSPPIMGVSDASILAREVDIVLQVIQYRRYPQPMTIRAKQMIEKVGGNLLGIVLNNINMASDESYYYYSGYYYDYYSSKHRDDEPDGKARDRSKKKKKTQESGPSETEVEIKPKY